MILIQPPHIALAKATMTFTDYIPHIISGISACIAIAALFFTGMTYWRRHVIRDDFKIRVVPPSFAATPPGVSADGRHALALNITLFNLGNRPIVLESFTVMAQLGNSEQIASFLEDGKYSHFQMSSIVQAYDNRSPGAKAQPIDLIGPETLATMRLIIMAPHRILKGHGGNSLLHITARFANSEGESKLWQIPFALYTLNESADAADGFHLDGERYKDQNDLIKIF